MRKFATHAQIFPQIVKLIAIKAEVLFGELEGVDTFVGARRNKTVSKKASIRLPNIKAIAIVSNHDVSPVKQFPKLSRKVRIAFLVAFIGGIIRKGMNVYFLFPEPFIGKGQDIPLLPEVNDVLFPFPPYISKRGGRLDIEQ